MWTYLGYVPTFLSMLHKIKDTYLCAKKQKTETLAACNATH